MSTKIYCLETTPNSQRILLYPFGRISLQGLWDEVLGHHTFFQNLGEICMQSYCKTSPSEYYILQYCHLSPKWALFLCGDRTQGSKASLNQQPQYWRKFQHSQRQHQTVTYSAIQISRDWKMFSPSIGINANQIKAPYTCFKTPLRIPVILQFWHLTHFSNNLNIIRIM